MVKTTYGIKCEEMAVNDVSPNKKEVTELIDRLNKYELSPCHLQDVIEDFTSNRKAGSIVCSSSYFFVAKVKSELFLLKTLKSIPLIDGNRNV